MAIEVLFLNGNSVSIDPEKGLEAAKRKVAEALGVLPGAVKITCSGEILTELREDLHASPCHAAVDQEQMAFAKQWEIMKQQMPLLDKQTLVLARLRHEHDLKLMELNLRVGGRSESAVKQAEWTLKEGGLSLQEETALVARVGKLKGLKALEEKVSKADRELFGKQEEFWTKAEECKRSLEAELKMQGIDPQELLHKFHISLLSATGPRLDRVREIYPDPCFCARCCSPLDRCFSKASTCNGQTDDMETLCPRLIRRETWSKPVGRRNKSLRYKLKQSPMRKKAGKQSRSVLFDQDLQDF